MIPVPLPPEAGEARAQDGRSLAEIAQDGRLLLVFLRHFG